MRALAPHRPARGPRGAFSQHAPRCQRCSFSLEGGLNGRTHVPSLNVLPNTSPHAPKHVEALTIPRMLDCGAPTAMVMQVSSELRSDLLAYPNPATAAGEVLETGLGRPPAHCPAAHPAFCSYYRPCTRSLRCLRARSLDEQTCRGRWNYVGSEIAQDGVGGRVDSSYESDCRSSL